MATALPPSGASAPTNAYTCDTSDLLMIHRFFSDQVTESIGLVAGVTDGDRSRAGIVSDHIVELVAAVHNHHHGEDELLWDTLEQRAPACSLHVEKMKIEHRQVADLLDVASGLLPAWRADASVIDRDALVAALTTLDAAFRSHIGQEEAEIMPIAAHNMSQPEWNKLAEHGLASVPKDRRLVQLGYMIESMPDAERSHFVKQLPPPVRVLYRLVGRGQYRKDRARLLGTTA